MSWFFGKKKHRELSPNSPEEQGPPDDGYIFVEKRNPVAPNADDRTSSLYPSLDIAALPYPPGLPGASVVKQGSLDNQINYLNCISFKLSNLLEKSMNDDLVIDQLRLDEIVSFIQRIKLDNYDYTFSLERNVISELNSQIEE
ncbi:uncharacterized protein LOC131664632 [Phymastichus coffea]|uniref:uncharacterized protein LOC131664632 n=1 Tax=Phymastichus coffea TaxID=108790 RepID=UPI00273B165A|nr:uncharacterized protein LOC131664632 [Phymastichus coffea]XP_058791878.1 uncharacterized protein LOC131664632 [Phymastichus coffea]XP_058791879.1 uncharacterized protein LOC131664632 [Phymastichus coffea]XP_058791880.1 uncharacterized protein LOC131664632 [Phymastichus coffea]XP_058791881.1 uncharacterized protein LOC131664632 [Phymastichus coffea]